MSNATFAFPISDIKTSYTDIAKSIDSYEINYADSVKQLAKVLSEDPENLVPLLKKFEDVKLDNYTRLMNQAFSSLEITDLGLEESQIKALETAFETAFGEESVIDAAAAPPVTETKHADCLPGDTRPSCRLRVRPAGGGFRKTFKKRKNKANKRSRGTRKK